MCKEQHAADCTYQDLAQCTATAIKNTQISHHFLTLGPSLLLTFFVTLLLGSTPFLVVLTVFRTSLATFALSFAFVRFRCDRVLLPSRRQSAPKRGRATAMTVRRPIQRFYTEPAPMNKLGKTL